MTSLDTKLKLAKALYGTVEQVGTRTETGTVKADSSNGTVSVMIGEVEYDEEGQVVVSEEDLTATIPIIGSAKEGDEVTVLIQGNYPVAIAPNGWGDAIEAKTTNYFWHDEDGAHVSETENDATTGKNVLIDSDSVDIRDGEDVLASFSSGDINLLKGYAHLLAYLVNQSYAIQLYAPGSVELSNKPNGSSGYENASLLSVAGDVYAKGASNGTQSGASLKVGKVYEDESSVLHDGAITVKHCGLEANLYAWTQITTSTGTTSKTIDISELNEIMITAVTLRPYSGSTQRHVFAVTLPIQAITSTESEVKLSGAFGTTSVGSGAWCKLSLTSFAGVNAYINTTSYISDTTWTVYGR